MAKLPISVQLYTLRDETAADMPGTLKKLKDIGYTAVETAGYGSLKSAKEMARAVRDAGLIISGAHVAIENLETDLENTLDEQAQLGNADVIVPYLGDGRRNKAGYLALAASLNKIGAACVKRQMTLSYHNHDFEFELYDNMAGLDLIWENSDPKLVFCELDCYWARRASVDPVAYIRMLGGRVKFLHLKDMEPTEKKFAPVGTGVIDFNSISSAGSKAGVKYGVVEQDVCYGMTPFQSVETSLRNLRKMGIA